MTRTLEGVAQPVHAGIRDKAWRPRQWLPRLMLAACLAGGALAGIAGTPTGPALADGPPTTLTNQGCGGGNTYTLPSGYGAVRVQAVGAAGATGSASGTSSAAGGNGDGVTATISGLLPNAQLDVCVGMGGGAGGPGYNGVLPGGAGGGASGVALGPDFSLPVVVAGGGGGGGGAGGGNGGNAGNAGAVGLGSYSAPAGGGGAGDNANLHGGAGGSGCPNGGAGSMASSAGPGVGGDGGAAPCPYAGGGGGGGGGYAAGGGGGTGSDLAPGGGGGGGSDFCADPYGHDTPVNHNAVGTSVFDCSVTPGAGSSTNAAQVTITPIALSGTATSTTVTSSAPSFSSASGAITLTATVMNGDGGGTVAFSDNGLPISNCQNQALSANGAGGYAATCSTSLSGAVIQAIDAGYSGDAAYAPSAGSLAIGPTLCPTSESDLQTAMTGIEGGATVALSCPTATTISFSPNAGGSTNHVGSGTITISRSVTLDAGASNGSIVFDGHADTELFDVGAGVSFGLVGLTLSNGSGSYGGAIDSGGNLTVTDSTFSNNSSGGSGGAIAQDQGGNLLVMNSTFSGNSASSIDAGGGAITMADSATVTGSTFSGNTASTSRGDGGGAIDVNGGTLTVTNSTFFGNSESGGSGGGAISDQGTLTVAGSTFSGNAASNSQNGGGALLDGGALTIDSTIIASSPSGGNCGSSGTATDNGYNLADDGTCGFTNGQNGDDVAVAGTAGLAAGLADNGGPTPTLALLPNSPAIGAGNPTTCSPSGLLADQDQRGAIRQTQLRHACDIGAYDTGGSITINKGWTLMGVPIKPSAVAGGWNGSASGLVAGVNSQPGGAAVTALATYGNGRFQLYVPRYTADTTLYAFQGVFVLSNKQGQWMPWTLPGASSYRQGDVELDLQPGWNLMYTPYPYRGLNGDDIDAQIGPTAPSGTNPCGLQELATYGGTGYQTYTPTNVPDGTAFHVPATAGLWIECTKSYAWTPR